MLGYQHDLKVTLGKQNYEGTKLHSKILPKLNSNIYSITSQFHIFQLSSTEPVFPITGMALHLTTKCVLGYQ